MLLENVKQIKDGRIITKDADLFECPYCKSTFARDFVKSKMKKWGADKSAFYTTKHCPNCDKRITLRDANASVQSLLNRIANLERYAGQCRITGDLDEYRDAMSEVKEIKQQIEDIRNGKTADTLNPLTRPSFKNMTEEQRREEILKEVDRFTGDDTGLDEITVLVRDPDSSLEKFLRALATHANPGHSFSVKMDEDEPETFGFDGDGGFYIKDIRVKGKTRDDKSDQYKVELKHLEEYLNTYPADPSNNKRKERIKELKQLLNNTKDASIGKHNDTPDSEFNAEELAMGIKIEMEHTDNEATAKGIAKDHLKEIPDYYTRLKKMEAEAKGSKDWVPPGFKENIN